MRWMECAIVDDNKFDRLICSKILQKITDQLDVFEFQTGREILDYLKGRSVNEKPLLILLDLNMPEMNGYEFLEEIHSNDSMKEKMTHVRIVIITSSTRLEDREHSLSFQLVAGYLQKPILTNKLAALLEDAPVAT